MPYIIDAHEDLAYNMLTFGRNYLHSVEETRRLEEDGPVPGKAGHTLLGWPEFQRGQVALVFSTLFVASKRYALAGWESQFYTDTAQAGRLLRGQVDLYRRLSEDYPDKFRLVTTRTELEEALAPWEQAPAEYPSRTHPVGLVLLMEGAEGVRDPRELEAWWQLGVRIIGPVWAGGRFCGGSYVPGGFTPEGLELLDEMARLGYTLDIAHMNEVSARQALDAYPGQIIASHANARALLKGMDGERHLSDAAIRGLVERDGVMGVLPFNAFLCPGWKLTDAPNLVTLETLAAHIDHICQIAGDACHVGLGTDFDGGFGRGAVPEGIDSIADMPRLQTVLAERGYRPTDIAAILGGNWRRCLERTLPES